MIFFNVGVGVTVVDGWALFGCEWRGSGGVGIRVMTVLDQCQKRRFHCVLLRLFYLYAFTLVMLNCPIVPFVEFE